ncbi:MAG: polysaccharide biosynthesis tyrosine autokinase [Leptolyngbyaceae cyanobacterium MO_188.B28]|nr:polysaccharide biosynthesis tyrosine autokinase [Leptolyngbyaceae cyanobacterium MO_188.B28]
MRADQRLPNNEPQFPGANIPIDENAEGGLEFGQALAAIRRRILLIAGVTTVVASAAVLKAITDTPIYSAGFEILTKPVTLESQLIGATNQQTLSRQQDLISVTVDATKLKILKSPRLIDPIVDQLQDKYQFVDYGQISGGLSAEASTDDVLTVIYQNNNPELVKDVLDLVSVAYIQFSLEDRQRDILRGIKFVDEQLPELRGRVDDLESKLEELRQAHNLIDPTIQGQQLSTQVATFVQEQLNIQVQLDEAQLLFSDLQRELTRQGEAAAASALTEDPRYQGLLAQLLEIDSQLAEQSTLFLEASPEIQILQEQRQNLAPLVAREGQRVQRQVDSRIRELSTRNQALGEAVDLLNQRIKQLSTVARQYSNIQRELEIATNNLDQFLSKREALRIDAAQKQAPWELLSQPGDPMASSGSVQRNLVLGTGLGLLLGIGAALMVDKLSSVIHTVKEVKDVTKLPLLGVIPFNEYLEKFGPAASVATRLKQAGYVFGLTPEDAQNQTSAPFIEAFRSLYASIRLTSPESQIQSLAISSPVPNSGKTTVSLHLGQAAAAMGQRVLIVDTDLRRPSLQSRLGLRGQQGLTEFVTAGLGFEEVLQKVPLDNNLFVVTAGSVPPDSTKVLSSKRMQQFMEQAKQNFDLVLYDTPPLLGFADAYLVAAQTAGFLMVVGLGRMKRSLLERSMDELRVSGINALGVVANGAKDRTVTAYSYYQYYTDQDFDEQAAMEQNYDDEDETESQTGVIQSVLERAPWKNPK